MPVPDPASVSLRFAPVIVELIVIPPVPSRRMTLSVELPRASLKTPAPAPINSKDAEPDERMIVFATPFNVAPLSVITPGVELLS